MNKKWLLPILAVCGIVFAINYVATATPSPPVAQPLTEPAKVAFKDYIGGAGLTEANSENIEIGTSLAGVVRAVPVEVGDAVKRDDVLFVIDDRAAQASLSQAVATVGQLRAEAQDKRNRFALVATISDSRAISKDERNQRRDAVAVADAAVKVANSAVNAAQVYLDLHTVRAPNDGIVMTKNIRVGEFANTNTMSEPLLRLGNISPMHIRVDIDENDAWRFKNGANAVAFVRGNPEIKVDLKFVRVEPYVRPKKSLTGDSAERVDTRVLQIIYAFDPKDKPIYIGQQMDAYIEVK
jgi:RND family efflux transporter MFP subunit